MTPRASPPPAPPASASDSDSTRSISTSVPGPAGAGAQRLRRDRAPLRHSARRAGARPAAGSGRLQNGQQPHAGVLQTFADAVRTRLADRVAGRAAAGPDPQRPSAAGLVDRAGTVAAGVSRLQALRPIPR